MNFQLFGTEKAPTLLLIPSLGVSYVNYQDLRNGCQVRLSGRKVYIYRGGYSILYGDEINVL